MREKISQKIQELEKTREQLLDNLKAINVAVTVCKQLLEPDKKEEKDGEKV